MIQIIQNNNYVANNSNISPDASLCKPVAQETTNEGNRFDFDRLLGSGTFSRVWAAYDRQLKVKVAVKHMRKAVDKDGKEGALKRQLQEYELTKDLCHVNIIRCLDCIVTEQDVVIVQELAAGGDLFDSITPDIGAPLNIAFRVLTQLVTALEYLLEKGIVHRDIKPENIVLGNDGTVKICDFGMAERAGTLVRGARGTIAYLAPELLPRRRDLTQKYPVDHASDTWGLGLILYALLVGAHPWTRAEASDKYYAAYIAHSHLSSYPWKLFPEPMLNILDRLFTSTNVNRCSLTEFKAFLENHWHTTAPVIRDRVEIVRAALQRSTNNNHVSSTV